MVEESEASEGSEDAEGAEVAHAADAPDADVTDALDASESDSDSDSDEWDGSEESGWFADPDVEGQERYFDGSDWTPDTRPADVDVDVHHLPDHAGELQRALAAATNDIDDVEDRLGNLFDRAQQHGQRGGLARKQAEEQAAGRAAEGRALAESTGQDELDSEEEWLVDDAGEDVDDGDAFADLDEALASEEPEKVKKGFFRRH